MHYMPNLVGAMVPKVRGGRDCTILPVNLAKPLFAGAGSSLTIAHNARYLRSSVARYVARSSFNTFAVADQLARVAQARTTSSSE